MSKQEFSYPPYPYLIRVLEYCPLAALIYVRLWRDKSDTNHFTIYKKDIAFTQFMSPTLYKNRLLMLVREGLISIDETPLMFCIELVGYDANYDEFGEELVEG